jgi:DNA polymerase-3 subunit epsilon
MERSTMNPTRQIFLDTETTGLEPENGDRIVEVGCIEMVNRRLTGERRHFYFNPQRRSHEDSIKVHGLTDEFLADKPLFGAVADDLMTWLHGAEVIIHNASFDVAFLNAELRRLNREPFHTVAAKITDSLALARELYPGKANSLDALCRRLEVDNAQRTLHGALLDAGLLAEVFIRMTRGQEALAIRHDADHGVPLDMPTVDLSGYTLVVIELDDDELAAHEAALAELDKASGGKTLWRMAMA